MIERGRQVVVGNWMVRAFVMLQCASEDRKKIVVGKFFFGGVGMVVNGLLLLHLEFGK